MSDSLEDVRWTTTTVRQYETLRAQAMAARDAAMQRAIAEGHTWAQIQEASGLTAPVVRRALKRR